MSPAGIWTLLAVGRWHQNSCFCATPDTEGMSTTPVTACTCLWAFGCHISSLRDHSVAGGASRGHHTHSVSPHCFLFADLQPANLRQQTGPSVVSCLCEHPAPEVKLLTTGRESHVAGAFSSNYKPPPADLYTTHFLKPSANKTYFLSCS